MYEFLSLFTVYIHSKDVGPLVLVILILKILLAHKSCAGRYIVTFTYVLTIYLN
jgi:hypothetical protein